MNDRYLYSAKRTDNEEWVEGNLVWSDDADDDYKAIIIPTTDSNMFTRGGARGDLGFENWCRVDPSTICQCTGLKDKNGKLIWENDIVNVSTNKGNTLCAVRYADSVAQFQLWQSKTLHKTSTVLNLGNYREEVCGNRFDNPELLEVRENET